MDKEARERLVKALEHIQGAQAHLIENVSLSRDPGEVRKNFSQAWELLLEASDLIEPMTNIPFSPSPVRSPGTAA